ncbi:MAG TPA: TetR/AcrR family transcriptional regulator [Polyangiaceae bacterium]|nr:TetR/AcrR family transcriptional regulator [Polyangiaceae bacterium]
MKKGAVTRARILDRAFRLAGRHGVEGVSLGALASDLGLSKSGLFAHFASKEELSVEVLRTTTERFAERVIRPALSAPRGEPRIRKMFDYWLAWLKAPDLPGGCPIVAASVELDDKPGVPRDFLVKAQTELLGTLAKAASLAVAEGHFRKELDTELFAFELMGVMLAYHHSLRLLRDERATDRARAAFERLLADSRS